MDLFDNYFRTLRLLLPKDQREDIVSELSEEVQSQVAEKEAALGRALNASEQEALLSQFGHPLLTASRYRPQRYLVGPILFPYYWLLLKVVVGLIVLSHVIGAVVLVTNGSSSAQLAPIGERMISSVLKALGWITLLASVAGLWLTRSRALENWRPRPSPAPLRHVSETIDHALGTVPRAVSQVSRSAVVRRKREPTISGFIVAAAVSVWWLLGLKFPTLLFGPGAADVAWGPAMQRLYPVLVVAQLLALSNHFIRLVRPADTLFNRLQSVAWLVTGVAFIYLVATSNHEWLVWRDDANAGSRILGSYAGRAISLEEFVNYTFSAIFGAVAVAGVVRLLGALLRRISRGRHTAVPA
jgi:hypothetical protein